MFLVKKWTKPTACLVGLISGGIGVLAYSPFDLWWVILFSVLGLLSLATQSDKNLARLGTFVWAVSYFSLGVNWVHVSMIQFGGVPEIVSYLAVLLLAMYLALYPLLFTYIIGRFHLQNPWSWAALWTLCEYLRATVFTGFPWLQFGYAFIDTPFAGIAPIFGEEGLSFFLIVIAGYILQLTRSFAKKSPNWRACLSLTGVLIGTLFSQTLQWVSVDHNIAPSKISLIQGNIAQQMKWAPEHFDHTLQTYSRLVGEVLGKSEVIILPESAIPAYESQLFPLLAQLDQTAKKAGSEIIIGTLHQNQQGIFNSAVVLGDTQKTYTEQTAQRFNKHHLVPFGEYLPFGTLLDGLREVFILPINLSQGDFIQAPLQAGSRRFNMAICYEIIFADQVQQNQKAHNADYLLTISNDAWFGESIGPWQHFQMARMRALELGRPLIRSTNTGISAFVDAFGKIERQAPQFETLVLSHEVKAYQGQTPFVMWGNWAIYLLSLCFFIGEMLMRRKGHNR